VSFTSSSAGAKKRSHEENEDSDVKSILKKSTKKGNGDKKEKANKKRKGTRVEVEYEMENEEENEQEREKIKNEALVNMDFNF
jgi:hypothetical protein